MPNWDMSQKQYCTTLIQSAPLSDEPLRLPVPEQLHKTAMYKPIVAFNLAASILTELTALKAYAR